LHGKCIPEIEGKENRSLAEKLDAARETGTVLGAFTMTLSTRGGYIHHGTAIERLHLYGSVRGNGSREKAPDGLRGPSKFACEELIA
jgi:hypothetical protein